MEESGSSMRPTPHLGEMTIKVPAPFAGISDLGFTARYRAQHFNEPQRDVPLLFEGPEPPMRRLAEVLRQLSETHSTTYAWTNPVMLSDEVVILAFHAARSGAARGGEARRRHRAGTLVREVECQRNHDHPGDDGQHEGHRPPLPTQHSPVHESSILLRSRRGHQAGFTPAVTRHPISNRRHAPRV